MINDADNIELKNQYQGFLKMPNIINTNFFADIADFTTSNIQTPNFDSKVLESIQKHIYLGKRAEYFMLHYLKQQEQFSNVLHSIQIQNETTTLGELDFLFFNKRIDKWIHLELVTKFYIYNSDEEHENYKHWIGPNLKDKFEFKLNKLQDHQLQLLNLPEAQEKLITLKIAPDRIKRQLCYKAKLFLPVDLKQFQHKVTNSACVCGSYFNLEHFKRFELEPNLYYVPKKLDWVSSPDLQSHWYSFDKALAQIKSSLKEKRSCMLWRKTPDGECLEDFVVWWS